MKPDLKNSNKPNRSRVTKTQVGVALAEELAEIVDTLGMDHPDLPSEILGYVTSLGENHPEWRAFWREQARRQQQQTARPHQTQEET